MKIFKKKCKPKFKLEPLAYYFAEKDVPTLYKYIHTYKTTRSEIYKYNLWKFISDRFVLNDEKNYRLDTSDILKPRIIEE